MEHGDRMTGLLQRTGTTQDVTIRLWFALGCTSAVAVTLSIVVAYLVLRGTPIHAIPQTGPHESRPGHLSDVYVMLESEKVIRDRYSWTYATIDKAHAWFKERLHPHHLKDFDTDIAPAEKKLVLQEQMSSGIVIHTTTVTEKYQWRRRVVVEATRWIYVGATVRPEPLTITVTWAPLIADGMPQGLLVWHLSDTVPLKGIRR
jgi:hypothetical protein